MTLKTTIIRTAAERSMGRLMRAPDGHGDAASPAPEAAPEDAPEPAEQDYAAFERSLETPAAPEDKEEKVSGDAKPATPETDDNDGKDQPSEESAERKGASAEERIGELTAKYRETERQLAEANRLRAEAERERDALRTPEPKPEERSEEKAPNPDDYEFGEADSKFITDLATYNTRKEFAHQQQQQQFRDEVAKIERGWSEKLTAPELKEKYADFDDKVTKGADRGDWDCSVHMGILIKNSDVGPDVAYHLATNAAEAKRIASLAPFEQALEIGRLEGRFSAQAAAAPKAEQAKTVTAAPPPPERARGAGGQFTVADDTEDFAAFEAKADGILNKK